jgi:hypothetical protein
MRTQTKLVTFCAYLIIAQIKQPHNAQISSQTGNINTIFMRNEHDCGALVAAGEVPILAFCCSNTQSNHFYQAKH